MCNSLTKGQKALFLFVRYCARKEYELKIIFNDATEIQVQSVICQGDYLSIKTIGNTPEELRAFFSDSVKTKKMIVEERGKQTVYEGYTTYYRSEEYPGKIYGIVNYRPEKAPEVQAEVQAAAVEVARLQAQSFSDEEALTVKAIYSAWDGNGIDYAAGYKVLEKNILYKCLQAHKSQGGWSPGVVPSLWAKVLIQNETVIPEWEQPGSVNGYSAGDRVTHNDTTYESLVDDNVWEPGVIGTEALWKEIS